MTELSKNTQVPQCDKTAVMQSAILPQDLRIGNIVFADLYDEKPILVESICSKNQDIFNSTTGEIPFTSLKPIELNEKWLEKMGFVRDDDTSYRWFILDRSVAYDLDDNCIRISDSWEFGKRKYIHELQNLIFFLSGIELAVAGFKNRK